MGLTHADFLQLFDQWAPTYDETVFREQPADGFEEYERVLERVAELAGAAPSVTVLDVGAGTGNLARTLLARGAKVVAVEPSREMRHVALQKLGETPVLDGTFLALPAADGTFDAAVSTYAFHHLADEEKQLGARELLRVLKPGGRVVLGDIAWASEGARQAMIRRFAAEGKAELVKEIEEEYYPLIGALTGMFAALGCTVYIERMTEWVWVLAAGKPSRP
jgi:putative AdoMet-dependent methyltransferase